MQATLWVLLSTLGFYLLWLMGDIKKPFLLAMAIRTSAFSFVGAGSIGAAGWFGTATAAVVAWANSVGAEFGAESFGSGAVWVVWLFASITWVLTILPESWFGRQIPDGLSVSGWFLPSLCVSIPGPVGDLFQNLFNLVGDVMVTGARHLIGAG
jgi:hypothetical protein